MSYNLEIINYSQVFADSKYLKEFRFANGKPFPYSYQIFVDQFGWGRALNNYLIYIPSNPKFHDSWQQAREDIRSTYINNIDEYIGYYPNDLLSLMERMEPFARSESGYYLFWDIYLLGKDLFEVFYNLTNTTEILQKCFNTKPWPKIFEGFSSIC